MQIDNPKIQAVYLSIYTMDELVGVDNFIESVGGALADAFTVNGGQRPLAQFADAMSEKLGEQERLVVGEIVKREQKLNSAAKDYSHDPPTEGPDLRSTFGEPDLHRRQASTNSVAAAADIDVPSGTGSVSANVFGCQMQERKGNIMDTELDRFDEQELKATEEETEWRKLSKEEVESRIRMRMAGIRRNIELQYGTVENALQHLPTSSYDRMMNCMERVELDLEPPPPQIDTPDHPDTSSISPPDSIEKSAA